MTTRRMSFRLERWPIAGEFRIARGSKTEALVVVVAIRDGGLCGRGEAVPYARYGESPASVLTTLSELEPSIARGMDRAALSQAIGAGAARNALDCALWDLDSQRSAQPVWQLLGSSPPRHVETMMTLPLEAIDATERRARAHAAHPILKVKVDGRDDEERVAAVQRAAPRARIVVDANEAWTLDRFVALSARLADLGVTAIEQPLPAAEDAALATVAHPVPVIADESCHDRATLPALVGRYEMVNIKLDKSGGLSEALAVSTRARELGLGVMVGCMVSTSLAVAPALLLAGDAELVDLDGPLLLARDRRGGIVCRGGRIDPHAPLWGTGAMPDR
jgi:L-alanine-DL-glutamate epimerase-like enolase superfamily enzyme